MIFNPLKAEQQKINLELQVTCALIVHKGRILTVQRGKDMNQPLKWEFPGGKLERNENELECIIREIREELDVHIEIVERLNSSVYQYPEFKIELIPFIAFIKKGNILLKEHKSYKWCDSGEITDLDWSAADVPVLHDFLKRNENERWIV